QSGPGALGERDSRSVVAAGAKIHPGLTRADKAVRTRRACRDVVDSLRDRIPLRSRQSSPGETSRGIFTPQRPNSIHICCGRTVTVGLEFIRLARLSWRSLWIPKPARTAHRPVPLGSHATPTRGCNSARALFRINTDLPTFGCVRMNPAWS